MHKNGTEINQKMKKLIIVFVSMPWDSGIPLCIVRNDGQIAAIMHLTALAPFMFWIANQNTAKMARETMAMYEPQKPHDARARTGKGAWWITPIAPLSAMTKEMMKNARATMPRDSRHVRPGGCQCLRVVFEFGVGGVVPIAMMLEANCHVAALQCCQCVTSGLASLRYCT